MIISNGDNVEGAEDNDDPNRNNEEQGNIDKKCNPPVLRSPSCKANNKVTYIHCHVDPHDDDGDKAVAAVEDDRGCASSVPLLLFKPQGCISITKGISGLLDNNPIPSRVKIRDEHLVPGTGTKFFRYPLFNLR
ncbi:hypothetical protein HanRHA438_Chr14g0679321 [Helianthus annuus]|nr:hypothetical protein HanRHA438_Chr14g0679321 [Helianthus annuus]